jgi:hypothetical protein
MVWKGLGEIGCVAVDCPASTAEDKKVGPCSQGVIAEQLDANVAC